MVRLHAALHNAACDVVCYHVVECDLMLSTAIPVNHTRITGHTGCHAKLLLRRLCRLVYAA